VNAAVSYLLPLAVFGGLTWLAFKALSAKASVFVLTFLGTFALAESPVGRAVWALLKAIGGTVAAWFHHP
jgi:hypothetical protein